MQGRVGLGSWALCTWSFVLCSFVLCSFYSLEQSTLHFAMRKFSSHRGFTIVGEAWRAHIRISTR